MQKEGEKSTIIQSENKYYIANRDRILANSKIYREKNRERLVEYKREYRKRRREELAEIKREIEEEYEKNKEEVEEINTSVNYIPQEKIESIAENIRRDSLKHTNVCRSEEIYAIAEKLGFKVEIVDFDPDTVSSRIIRNNDSVQKKITIQISRKDDECNFSVAKQISNMVLHDDGKNEFVEISSNSVLDHSPDDLYRETQSSMLAMSLLMPKNDVEEKWEDIEVVDLICSTFDVSLYVACTRLSTLNLLNE